MDNCGCGPGAGSMLSNQSDNLMGGGFSLSNNNNMGTSVPVQQNTGNSTGMNPVITSNVNSNNNSTNLNDLLNVRKESSNDIASSSNILEAIAKNNINELNNMNNAVETEGKKVGEKVANTAKETIALSKKHILLATIFTLALAWNDAIKYYIGRSIKLNKASPFYYLYYALIVTLITVIVHHLLI